MNVKIREVNFTDAGYPQLLREIERPPEKMYYMGNLDILKEKTVAIVGSRKATAYGIWVAETLGGRLADCGITVVSGLAKGVDYSSHKGALASGGRTVAVMGNGIDSCTPASHRCMWRRIAEDGLVISEYPPGTPGSKFTYPKRNRIISGLSIATVVVEAGIQSGSLITAELAAEQGRTVYAVPGNINSVISFGTNRLIRDGAVPLTVLDDILVDLGVDISKLIKDEKGLSDDEKYVYSIIKSSGEMYIDQICRRTRMSAAYINSIITVLEMKGKICLSLGRVFVNRA